MGTTNDNRTILAVTGTDRNSFLQGLVSNDVDKTNAGLVYAALLSPQGKYLFDFFMLAQNDAILIDVAADMAAPLSQRLNMYRLRADVAITATDLGVSRGTATPPEGAFADPRHPALGWRLYGSADGSDGTDWDAVRVTHCIPQSGIELIPNDTFILEAGFEALNGVDFRKGCYVGQEVTARMKHKTELKKGLAKVQVKGAAPVGTDITMDGKSAGTLFTQAGGNGIAYLRFSRASGPMQAGKANVTFTNLS